MVDVSVLLDVTLVLLKQIATHAKMDFSFRMMLGLVLARLGVLQTNLNLERCASKFAALTAEHVWLVD